MLPYSLLVSICCVGSFVRGQSASFVPLPWPAIPTQQPYSKPTGPSYVYPISIAEGLTDSVEKGRNATFVFSKIGDVFTLDYGVDIAGKPFFEVASVNGYAQIEVKYSETFTGLKQHQSDGPYTFANGLSSNFRVETFNITQTGLVNGYFIHGSQRWQSMKLVAGSGLSISKAGFTSSVDQTPLSSIEGYFASSNSTYTDIWALGPRTQQLVCFLPGTQSSTWDITDKGAYIRGQKPASTARVVNLVNYTLSFETMIDFGGTGWRVDTEIDGIQATGPLFVLTSDYPSGSFSNIDRSLLPPNTLVLGRGWALQNQTSLPGFVLDKFPIGFNVSEKIWHTVKTVSPGDQTYTVYLDDVKIAHFNISSYGLGDPNPYILGGTHKGFSLGPWQDQAAYFRNVNATLATGENVYSNPMTSDDVLIEYGVKTNDQTACSDSGKRDRYSWLGDRLNSARTVMVGTGQYEFVWGPAEQAISRQVSSGQVPICTLFSPLDTEGFFIRTANVEDLLGDYMFDFMQIIYEYWMRSGNDTFITNNWPNMVAVTSYAISRSLDQKTQLYGSVRGPLSVPTQAMKGQGFGPTNTVSLIIALERMAEMAQYFNHNHTAKIYLEQAALSRKAIETLLWNTTGGFYASTLGNNGYDMTDIAQVLLAEIGSVERRDIYIEKLDALRVPAGYINGSNYFDTPGIVNPYYSSFLLEGLAKAGKVERAQELLDSTWSPMVRRDSNYTGAYWEYVSPDGSYPGLDLFTGQSHFWGSYPTTFLTEWALGVRSIAPGYSQFLFAPLAGFKTDWVHGRVPTPAGIINAAWGIGSTGKMVLEIDFPANTTCVFVPPFDGTYSLGGKAGLSGNMTIGTDERVVRITED